MLLIGARDGQRGSCEGGQGARRAAAINSEAKDSVTARRLPV